MKRVIFTRSPEAEFRPERHVADVLVDAMLAHPDIILVELESSDEFTTLDNQKLFYDDASMTRSFAKALTEVTANVRDGDVVFFADAWMPAIPAIKFHLHCAGTQGVKLCGIFHSSVETPGDFLATAGEWVRRLEADLVTQYLDRVFVATGYGYNTLHSNTLIPRDQLEDKVVVTGLPLIRCPYELPIKKDDPPIILFSHRWAEDKDPEFFIKLARHIKGAGSSFEFTVAHPVPFDSDTPFYTEAVEAGINFVHCPARKDYWELLCRSTVVISTAQLETFGYSILEGIDVGCYPFVPNNACYPYMYPPRYIYDKTWRKASIHSLLNDLILYRLVDFDPAAMFLKGIAYNRESLTAAEDRIIEEVLAL